MKRFYSRISEVLARYSYVSRENRLHKREARLRAFRRKNRSTLSIILVARMFQNDRYKIIYDIIKKKRAVCFSDRNLKRRLGRDC